MKYRVIDLQLNDYVAPYDDDKDYWTLEEIKDLAWRRLDDWEWEENEAQQKIQLLSKVKKINNEEEVATVLNWFDYDLERVEHE